MSGLSATDACDRLAGPESGVLALALALALAVLSLSGVEMHQS